MNTALNPALHRIDSSTQPEQPPRLTSWTRTLNENDALALLDNATPGMTLSEWETLAHMVLPQARHDRRRELVNIVREELLDHDGSHILPSAFLRLLQNGSPWRRIGLLYGRRLFGHPLAAQTLHALLLPALARRDEPLAPEEASHLEQADWARFLHETLHPDTGPQAFEKTRSTLQRHFARLRVLEISGHTRRTTLVQHSEPDPIAFCWLLAHELVSTGQLEVEQSWVMRQSFASQVFAVRPTYAIACLHAGIQEGLLVRGYLAGVERLHPGEVRR
ncbi:MAG: hypothetical protein ACKO6N_04270 [Myxococcota bacterium]